VDRRETDGELIAGSQGEPEKFVLLFDRHFDAIYRYVRRRVGENAAEDLVAQTFLEAFERRGSFDTDRDDARPWLFGIAINLLRHHYRDEERRLRAFARHGAGAAESDTALSAAQAPLASELADALARIRGEERDVLLLFAWGDLSYREIAMALQLPLGTVRSRLNRARHQLQERLREAQTASGPAHEREDRSWMT
jgi:RNA polymerase sigma factor (sigma-70 family)